MATNAEVLASSTAAAQAAAKMIGGTFTQGVGFTPTPTGPSAADRSYLESSLGPGAKFVGEDSPSTYSRLPAAPPPTSTPDPTQPNSVTGVSQADVDAANNTQKVTPFDEASRRQALMDAQKDNLDYINKIYDAKVQDERTLGDKYAGRYNSISAMSGMAGTPDATSTQAKNDRATQDRANLVNEERGLKLQAVYDKVDQNLIDEKTAALATNKANAAALLKKVADNADAAIAAFASTSGVTFDDWKSLHGQELQDIMRQTGKSEQTINAEYNASLDAQSKVDYKDGATTKLANGNAGIFQYGQNVKGKSSTRTIDTGLAYDDYVNSKYEHFEGKDGSLWTFNPDTGKASKIQGATDPSGTGAGSGMGASQISWWADAGLNGANPNAILPSLGMGAAAVATKNKMLAGIADKATTLGISGSTFAAMLGDSKAKQAVMKQVQAQNSLTQVNEESAGKYFDRLSGFADKVTAKSWNTAVPFLNDWVRSGILAVTGDSDVNNLLTQMTESLTEYAKVMSGQTTGAAVHEAAAAAAKQLLSQGFNASTIKSFVNTAKANMKDRSTSYNDAYNSLFSAVANLSQNQANGTGPGGQQDNTVTTPDGQVWTFPDAASAAAFSKEAGL